MRLNSKILAFLMIATLAAGCYAAQVPSLSARSSFQSPVQSNERPSGCHEHGGQAPARAPSHDCCLAGHDVAVIQVHQLQPPSDVQCHVHAVMSSNPASVTAALTVFQHSVILSPAPPGSDPLRI
jgi:hypothetical protein